MSDIILKDESYRIMGACFEVYMELGCGFLEGVYHECLFHEFALYDVPFQSKVMLNIKYKGRTLTQTYVPDFLCYQQIILEIKAVSELGNEHRAQIHNYLKATGHRLGLLVNFGAAPKLKWERVVR